MKKRNLFLIVSVCLVGAIFVFLMNRQTEKTQASGSNDMFREINSSALSAQSGQQTDIGNLVDTIFAQNGVDQLDPNLVASLKDRIVRAQMNGQTVSEAQVVQALNWLADEFSAPTYARTSLLQTRGLKLVGNELMPNLFVDQDNQGNISVNKTISGEPLSNMPATQAVTLLVLLIEQKVLNANFQKDPDQWDSDFYNAQQSGGNAGGGSDGFIARDTSQKTREMRQLVYGTSLSQANQERIMQETLDQLGIAR